MELIFLGTGAGELWPSPFCDCRRCRDLVAAGWRRRCPRGAAGAGGGHGRARWDGDPAV